MKPLHIAIVGCGYIASSYARSLQPHPHIVLSGATDLDRERAHQFVETYGGQVYESLEEILADELVDLVVNLTIHHAHFTVIRQCLNASKHVYSEKPLALTAQEAWELVNLAQLKGVHLLCAPITLFGEAQQTAWKIIRDGSLGIVRLAYAEMNWGRIETGLPAPVPFFQVGPLFDVGVYPLTMLTTILGPARKVTGFGTVLLPNRVTQCGTPFQVETPDFVTATIEFEHGGVARLTANFYVGSGSRQKGIEFHGDQGSLSLESAMDFNSALAFARPGEAYQTVPFVKKPFTGVEWCRGIIELAGAIYENRLPCLSSAQAAHVVDILCAIQTSFREGRPTEISSGFVAPTPLSWAT